MSLSPEARKTLAAITTATITTVLLKKGLRNVWMRGARPLRPGLPRLVGPAFTLRFVPAREDLATPESWSSPISTRTAIEAMPDGCIAVVDAMGITDAGIFGDILCARMMKRGVTALVTDGVVRDVEGVLGTNLPVWCDGYAAPPSVAGLTFVGWGEPIGCGGVAVFPNDIVVADQDGCVLIPQAMLDHVLNEGVEQERMEAWIVKRGEQRRGAAGPLSHERRNQGALRRQQEVTGNEVSHGNHRRRHAADPPRAEGKFYGHRVAGPRDHGAGAGAAELLARRL
ncbi:regulator of RNase E activity RraA [Bradyrhizobium sp. S3.14.4]